MKYFTLRTVVNAYKANSITTKNKFWGLLSILSSIESTVEAGINYDFNTGKVSELLENLFYLGDEKKIYSGTTTWNIVFSNKWTEKVSEQMLGNTPNIYDVLVWYFRKEGFNDDITDTELVTFFLERVHISVEDAKRIFDFNSKQMDFSESLYSDKDLHNALGISGNCITAESSSVVAHPGELARAPFIQTLYAGQSTMECLIITPFKFADLYGRKVSQKTKEVTTLQKIYYGCPGTGKSHEVKEMTEGLDGEKTIKFEDGTTNVFRTTFHPDYDYSTFVGCYKPVKENGVLDYKFVPQVFTNAYVTAKKHPDTPIYLIIEEINRGNCAQIFGDLFQLLDRDNGVSKFLIDAEEDLMKYLRDDARLDDYIKIALPANFNILATMNTSDQSLFPMDSAFKRRWEMKYIKIDYDKPEANFTFNVGGQDYHWLDYLPCINDKITLATDSEDKQMGEFFIRSNMTATEFKNKVMFYLWNDVCKDLYAGSNSPLSFFFRDIYGKPFKFTELFNELPKDASEEDKKDPRKNGDLLLVGFLYYVKNGKQKAPKADTAPGQEPGADGEQTTE